MGLAAAKNRRKLGKDPNNTKWSRNTESFGQKILRSHGWEPGQYLGAKDAPHASLHTAANASHIRVIMREDNLGLGAQRNRGDECTGLDAFQDLLGRLNGKTQDVLESERKIREDLKLNLYVQRKLGTMNFVAGGWLVGDKVHGLSDDNEESRGDGGDYGLPDPDSSADRSTGRRDGKSKKRKAESSDSNDAETNESEQGRDKSGRKQKAVEPEGTESKEHRAGEKRLGTPKNRISKKRSSRTSNAELDQDASRNAKAMNDETASAAIEKLRSSGEDRSDSVKAKKSKKEGRKGDRKESGDTGSGESVPKSSRKNKKRRREREPSGDVSEATTAATTPLASGTSTPSSQVPSRHLARQRFIAQKRLSVLDPQALNQIFMIKSDTS